MAYYLKIETIDGEAVTADTIEFTDVNGDGTLDRTDLVITMKNVGVSSWQMENVSISVYQATDDVVWEESAETGDSGITFHGITWTFMDAGGTDVAMEELTLAARTETVDQTEAITLWG